MLGWTVDSGVGLVRNFHICLHLPDSALAIKAIEDGFDKERAGKFLPWLPAQFVDRDGGCNALPEVDERRRKVQRPFFPVKAPPITGGNHRGQRMGAWLENHALCTRLYFRPGRRRRTSPAMRIIALIGKILS